MTLAEDPAGDYRAKTMKVKSSRQRPVILIIITAIVLVKDLWALILTGAMIALVLAMTRENLRELSRE